MSKLRTGPATLLVHGVPSPACTTGAPGSGYGRKSGSAVGIGEELLGLAEVVNPEKPVSSPFTWGFPPVVEPSGSELGPMVRCRMSPEFVGSTPLEAWRFPIW